MTFLTGAEIINDAASMVQDQSTAIRAKMLSWLNIGAQQLAVVRPWLFLQKTAIVTPISNVITKPNDYGELVYIDLPTYSVYDNRNRLTPGEAYQADNTNMGYSFPVGFTEDSGTITLHGASWTVPSTLGYLVQPTNISDSVSSTIWPVKCKAYFMRYVLNSYYEYDMDERFQSGVPMLMNELAELKKWDNSQKPKTQNSRHGYRKTR